MHVMCCRLRKPYITYTEAVSVVLRDNLKCCFWLSYVVQILLAIDMLLFHFLKVCCDFVYVVKLIEQKVKLEINYSSKVLKSLVIIPFLLMFSIHKLRSLAFLSIMSSVAFCLCEYSF